MKNEEFYNSVKDIMKEMDMSEEDIYNYFHNEISNYKKNEKIERTKSKDLYKKIKKAFKSDFYTGFDKSILHYADILRHNSYDNKVVLFNYAQFGIKNLTIGNVEIYKKFKDYTIKYDKLAKIMPNKILSYDKNIDFKDVRRYVDESINRLNNENEDLTSHVFQIARINQKVKSKRIV